MRTSEEKAGLHMEMALELNALLPRDICLKGDKTFWINTNNNAGVRARPATQQEVLELVYEVIQFRNRMTSI